MRAISDCRLYGILDLGYVAEPDAVRVATSMIEGGVDIIQLRAKKFPPAKIVDVARQLCPLSSDANVPLIINDHAEAARDVAAEGVHVGQDDISIARVREIVEPETLVGKSTHSLDQAFAAQTEGADYIGFGPLFATPTKPTYKPIGLTEIARAHSQIDVPIFCIGGITIDNLQSVIDAGARRVVIVSGLLQAGDIVEYARRAKQMLARNS